MGECNGSKSGHQAAQMQTGTGELEGAVRGGELWAQVTGNLGIRKDESCVVHKREGERYRLLGKHKRLESDSHRERLRRTSRYCYGVWQLGTKFFEADKLRGGSQPRNALSTKTYGWYKPTYKSLPGILSLIAVRLRWSGTREICIVATAKFAGGEWENASSQQSLQVGYTLYACNFEWCRP